MNQNIYFTITGSDVGIFAFGRNILREYNKANLKFVLTRDSENALQEKLLVLALQKILTTTRFGRIGIMHDRKNLWAKKKLAALNIDDFAYQPADSRANLKPEIHIFEYPVLRDMALEGLADSVEFRRLTRKYLRPAKQANCDTILLLDDIMGSDSARKQWTALAGTQREIICLSDFVLGLSAVSEKKSAWEQAEKRSIEIELDEFWTEQKEFVYEQAQKVLRTKLKK
jgi:hypothetical protein